VKHFPKFHDTRTKFLNLVFLSFQFPCQLLRSACGLLAVVYRGAMFCVMGLATWNFC
jgi:hypothetical protein